MNCPVCNGTTKVLESRRKQVGKSSFTYRRRECLNIKVCGARFSSEEHYSTDYKVTKGRRDND